MTTTRTKPNTELIIAAMSEALAEMFEGPAELEEIVEPLPADAVVRRSTGDTPITIGIAVPHQSVATVATELAATGSGFPTDLAATIVDTCFAAIAERVGSEFVAAPATEWARSVRFTIGDATVYAAVGEVEQADTTAAPPSVTPHRLADVRLDVSVELGRALIPVRDLLALDEGGVIRLSRTVGEPVDLVINGTTTAQGEVVVVDGRLGLRITSVV